MLDHNVMLFFKDFLQLFVSRESAFTHKELIPFRHGLVVDFNLFTLLNHIPCLVEVTVHELPCIIYSKRVEPDPFGWVKPVKCGHHPYIPFCEIIGKFVLVPRELLGKRVYARHIAKQYFLSRLPVTFFI